MGLFLLGVEVLAALLLFAAALTAVAARLRPGWLRSLVAGLPTLAVLAYWVWACVELSYAKGVHLFGGALALTIALAVGTTVILLAGLWRGGKLGAPNAHLWPAGRLALGGVAAVLLAVATTWMMASALHTRVAALRAEAGSLALAAAPARVPDREDAAPLYAAAFELLRNRPDEPTGEDGPSFRYLEAARPIDPNDPGLKEFLARRAGGVDLLRRGARRPAARITAGPWEETQAVSRLRTVAAFLALSARAEAARGQAGPALRDAAAVFAVARQAADNTDLYAVPTAAAIETVGLKTLDDVLTRVTPTADDLAPLRDLEPGLYRPLLARGLQTERAWELARLASVAEQGWGWGLLFLDEELAASENLFNLMQRDLAQPYPECLRGLAEVAAQAETPAPATLTRLAFASYVRMVTPVARADAARRLVQLGTAVAAYRAGEGKYPARAEDLVPKYLPQVPPDPFTGEPLKLIARAGGVVVYSVGPDGVDNGGRPLEAGEAPPIPSELHWPPRLPPPPKGDITLRIGPAG
jgi:hypothetical protein